MERACPKLNESEAAAIQEHKQSKKKDSLSNWRQKKREVVNEGEEDGISKLPDSILHEIISYINIKSAVQTSVLSKRWRYVWSSQPPLRLGPPSRSR